MCKWALLVKNENAQSAQVTWASQPIVCRQARIEVTARFHWGESFCLLYYTRPKLLFLNEFQLSTLCMLNKFQTKTEAAQRISDQVTEIENAPTALHFSKSCHMSEIRNLSSSVDQDVLLRVCQAPQKD